jgi:hypothetical protein
VDPRTHVAHALVRLLAAPAPLPARGTAEFRNRLLDETGGDFRPLVQFLLQLAEAGMVHEIEAAALRGERWEDTHRRLAMGWTAEHYTQPEMARWGVAAWGAALGRCAVPDDAPPPAAAARAPSHASAPLPPGRPTARGSSPPRPPLPPTTLPVQGPRRSTGGGSAALGGRRPYLNTAEWRALAAIGVTGLVGALLIAVMSPFEVGYESPVSSTPAVTERQSNAASGDTPSRPAPPSTAPESMPASAPPAGTVGDAATVERADTLAADGTALDARADTGRAASPGPNERVDAADDPHAALRVSDGGTLSKPSPATAPAAPTPDASRELDALAISRYSALTGTARLGGIYRLTVNREGIYGDDRCATIGARIDWNQRTIDTIAVDVNAASFRFISRPSLVGRVAAGGVFFSRVIVTERDGTRSSFRLQGQLTPWGFQATGETRTETMLRWRRTVHCQFVAALSGERVP